ncbi:MAG: alpha/beta fold hydrolase [Ilumatobacteraceae bacterium]
MTAPILPGAEPMSHVSSGTAGALVLHGFTGNPSSMRGVADAFAAAGFHVELPRLPGHGTVVEEMLPTRWADWLGEAEAALARLRERAEQVVVVGLSMGGTLTLTLGANHPDLAGLICVNPAAQPQPDEVVAMVTDFIDQGMEVMPGIGSDIADPDTKEIAYDSTPLRALPSLAQDGLAPLAQRYPQMRIPLPVMTSPQDHVVDPGQSEFLAASYAGPVERISLERSYHVATQDYDKDLIVESAVEFARRVTA